MEAGQTRRPARRHHRGPGLAALPAPLPRHPILRRGADLATVRDTLGHESIATTSRYLHALALPPGAVTYGQIARTNQISVERVRQLEQRAFDAVAGAATTPGTPSAQFAALLRATIAPERPNALDRIDRIATALFPTGWRAARGATVARLASLTDLVLGLRRNRHWPACNDRG